MDLQFSAFFRAGFPALTLSYVSNSSIALNWSDFHTRHRRKDDIASYRVYYGLSRSDQVDEVTVEADQDSLLLTGVVVTTEDGLLGLFSARECPQRYSPE